MRKVYLVGSVRKNEWRESLERDFCGKFEFLKPEIAGCYPTEPRQFTIRDLLLVKQADIVFAYIDKEKEHITGSAAELGYAKGLGKTTILCIDNRNPKLGRFTFIREMVDIFFTDYSEAVKFLGSLSDKFGKGEGDE